MYDLEKLLKKKEKSFNMTEKESESFYNIQNSLKQELELVLPNFNKKFHVQTDASNLVISGVLLQKDIDNVLKHIFCSRKLNDHEINYTILEKKCLAIIWSLKKSKPYLANEFEVQTDLMSLTQMLSLKDPNEKIYQMAI